MDTPIPQTFFWESGRQGNPEAQPPIQSAPVLKLSLNCGHSPPLLKALPAEHRTSLCRLEGHGRVLAALRTTGAGFNPWRTLHRRRCYRVDTCHFSRFAVLAPFGFVLEPLVVEEQLLTGCEDEVRTTVDTLQYLVLELHDGDAPLAVQLHASPLRNRTRGPSRRAKTRRNLDTSPSIGV
jgi:hypothetical protein